MLSDIGERETGEVVEEHEQGAKPAAQSYADAQEKRNAKEKKRPFIDEANPRNQACLCKPGVKTMEGLCTLQETAGAPIGSKNLRNARVKEDPTKQ